LDQIHTQEARAGVAQLEVFIFKLVAIDRLATGAITLGEVTTLNHEVLDDTVESGVLVAEALFACGQGTEQMVSMKLLGQLSC
jgi:hypothetical protein